MVALYGGELTRRQVAERSGMLAQFAGVRLMTLGDGVERGILMRREDGHGGEFG